MKLRAPITGWTLAVALAAVVGAATSARAEESDAGATLSVEPLSMVVMDPLAAPLSCPCVEGYAQRKYEVLAQHVEKAIGRPVTLTFAESLTKALQKEGCTTAHLVIGKDSVVRADAKTNDFAVRPLARLTGLDGKTTQTGLIVVPSADPAQSVEDLKGYKIIFGPGDCSEKSSAPRQLLEEAGVELPPPGEVEISAACSDGACKIIEWGSGVRGAAVISSYAAPLLEGCGTIKKGDLRVVAETAPVPFITAFVTDKTSRADRRAIRKLLLNSASEPELLTALESMEGFVPLGDDYPREEEKSADKPDAPAAQAKPATTIEKSPTSTQAAPAAEGGAAKEGEQAAVWPGWRGPGRDGRAASLPEALPSEARIVWSQPLGRSGLGGVAATDEYVVIGDRDAANAMDVWRCYAAADGAELWTVEYAAPGRLDYDNAPRATPQIEGEFVYLAGAFGHLHCVDLATGAVLWQKNFRDEFGASDELVWGACASPLVVDGKVIVNPGAPDASIVALDALSGEPVWQSPGDIHAFASPLVATLGGVRQIVAYDRSSLGGWDVETGERLWSLTPPQAGDFNVPTPVVVGKQLLVVSENNGARLHDFDDRGRIVADPAAYYPRLEPDMSTPVAVGSRIFCVWNRLFCLDAANGLKPVWIGNDRAFLDFGPIIASDRRVLALGRGCELLLVDAQADKFELVSRLQVFDDPASRDAEPFCHPALVGTRLYVRGENALACVELGER
jgi:outer membrane protein assembly factor BamB/ABC-type phosphate/phosphonate transport system substrate-binding protein